MSKKSVYMFNLLVSCYVVAKSEDEALEILRECYNDSDHFRKCLELSPSFDDMGPSCDDVVENLEYIDDWAVWAYDSLVMNSDKNLEETLKQIEQENKSDQDLRQKLEQLISKDPEILQQQFQLLEMFEKLKHMT